MPRFPRPSGPKQFFTWVYFPSAWFLKNLLGYVSLSFTAPTCREEWFHCASFPLAFQIIFDTGLLSLSLVSQKLVGYVSLSFMSPTCRVVSLGLENLTKYVPRFPRPARSGPKQFFMWVSFPSAWFLKNLLGNVSLSFTAPTHTEESFHLALRPKPTYLVRSSHSPPPPSPDPTPVS